MASFSRQAAPLVASAIFGGISYALVSRLFDKKRSDPEDDFSVAHGLVWNSIGGAMCASMLYIGDKLELYCTLRELCKKPDSSTTAIELANETGLNQRWLREWLAQQAAMGVLILLPGSGNDDASLRYRLPWATAQVLANPDSKEYDIAMIETVPSLVSRAKTMLPQAFQTGVGLPYNEQEVANGIDRHHKVHIRDVFLPKVVPKANGVLQMLQQGIKVADLGCGAGNLLIAMAKQFPNSTFYGFEISSEALEVAAHNIAKYKLRNVFLSNVNEEPSLGDHLGEFDLVTTFDVLHDSTDPADLIGQVKRALKPQGTWFLADIPSESTIRRNICHKAKSETYFAFSISLCMSCSLSSDGGAGLGTLGFTLPVAKRMLKEGGFEHVKVLSEESNARWFECR